MRAVQPIRYNGLELFKETPGIARLHLFGENFRCAFHRIFYTITFALLSFHPKMH